MANVNDAPTGMVTISGTPTEDQTLTADTSGISDADGLGAFSYQWQRDGVDDRRRDRQHLHAGRRRRRHADQRAWSSYTDGHGTAEGPDQCGDRGR